ncbi:hypothetical protein BLNAU_17589 [Blattamonas nauphoetae]|uniref:Uncharacterized protein n=1 Tax=Blattamonas nauphoetae TaxID=2049346 RepID=A0ABQ9X790_9EUKA|nr:hypothetical protein BLNAU_17589 [Blattamonas nauphoetae]
MLVGKDSSTPRGDNAKAKQTNLVEVFLRQLDGKYKPLRPFMLDSLLVLAKESDWAISAILDVGYIKPLEQFCEQTNPSDVPISLPQLLYLLGKTSEAEYLRICESSIPSFLLKSLVSNPEPHLLKALTDCLLLLISNFRLHSAFLAHHEPKYLASIDHFVSHEFSAPQLLNLTQQCFSPQLDMSKMALIALFLRSKSDLATRDYLHTHKMRSTSTDTSSELVPFTERLCSMLAERVSQIPSLFTESSPGDPTNTALSTTLHDESPSLTREAVLEMLCEGLALLNLLLAKTNCSFAKVLIDSNLIPLLKSTIICYLDQIELQKTESLRPTAVHSNLLINILDHSRDSAASCLSTSHKSLTRVVQSTFSDVPELCSLLVRTCQHSSPTHTSHLKLIINFGEDLPHLIPPMLEENLIEQVFNKCKPMTVPTAHRNFHGNLIFSVASSLMLDPEDITEDEEEQKRIVNLQFERALKPAKQYLQFILQREVFIPEDVSSCFGLSFRITELVEQTLKLERDVFKCGAIVETGREEWEVGWLMEKTKEDDLERILGWIRYIDFGMNTNEKQRWKKRAERQREAGHEDAIEGWLMKKDSVTSSYIVSYLQSVSVERGMNNTL